MSTVRVFGARWPSRAIATAALAILLVAAPAVSAFAASPPSVGDGRVLGVSLPPDALELKPGETRTVDVRITNAGDTPFPVTVVGRALHLGDDGAVSVGSDADVRWQNQIDFPKGALTIPAQGWRDAPVTIRMPAVIEPDTYLAGFVVSPVASRDGSVRVVNQVAMYLTIDVPGPRNRRVEADFSASGVVFGTKTEGKVRVRNVGHVATRFWAETDVTSSPGGGTPQQARLAKTLLPAGRAKSFSVVGRSHWPVGFVTMKVRVTYPGTTDSTTREIVLSHRILVIHPFVVYAALALLLLVAVWVVRRIVERRRAQRPRARTTRGSRDEGRRGRDRVTRPERPVRQPRRSVTARHVDDAYDEPAREPAHRASRRARPSGLRGWLQGGRRRTPARAEPSRRSRPRAASSDRGPTSRRQRSRRR